MGIRAQNHLLAVAVATAALAPPAVADPQLSMANQRNILPGARAALMGGAYTALSDDATGSYYNPAGMAFSKDKRLEVSATAMRSTKTVFEDAVRDEPFDERSQEIYPSFVGGTTRLGPLTVGYSFMTLDARNVYQQSKYDDISTEPGAASMYGRTYQEASNYIWAGGSAALQLGDRLSIGSSVFYYQRNVKFSTNEIVVLNGGGVRTITDTLKALNTGIAAVNGLVWRDKTWSVGLAARTAMAISDDVTLLQDVVDSPADGSPPDVTFTTMKYRPLYELNPPTYSLGAAWLPGRAFTLSADILLHEGVRSPYRSRGGSDLHTTLNYSLGLELRLGPASLMAGWFTNHSMNRPPAAGTANQPVFLDYTGLSGGVGWEIGKLQGQLGAIRQDGRGKAQIRAGDTAVQDVKAETATWLVSGKVPL